MSQTERMQCLICKNEFAIDKYSHGACPVCGAVFQWEEGYVFCPPEELLPVIRQWLDRQRSK